jgi:hypothetical protein
MPPLVHYGEPGAKTRQQPCSPGETIIILLQKYDIFGYTTGIEQLRDPQANSKQDSFSALFNLDYVAASRHINP